MFGLFESHTNDENTGDELEDETRGAVPQEEPPRIGILPDEVERQCTDVRFLLFTILVFSGVGWLSCSYVHKADLRRLTQGYSFHKLLCTTRKVDDPHDLLKVPPTSYTFWCLNSTGNGLDLEYPQCLQECPISAMQKINCGPGGAHPREAYPSTPFGVFCMPLDGKLHAQVTHSFSSMRGALLRYLYIVGLFLDAKTVVNATFNLITFLPLGTGIYLLLVALQPGSALDVYSYINMDESDQRQQKILAGSTLLTLGLGMWCITSAYKETIKKASDCLEAAGDCVTEEWSILVAPLGAIAAEMVICAVGYYIVACVAAVLKADDIIKLPEADDPVTARRIGIPWKPQEIAQVFGVVVIMIWAVQIVLGATKCAMAYVTEIWYFTPPANEDGSREREEYCVLIKAYCQLVRYHIGTISFGAFLSVVGGLPAYVIGWLQVFKMCRCSCSSKFRQYVLGDSARFAYIDLCLHSESYLEGGMNASKVLKRELMHVHELQGALWMFHIAGVGLCMTGSAYILDLAIRVVPSFSDPNSTLFILETRGVFMLNGITGMFIGHSIMLGFDTVFDTLLYCYAIQLKREKEALVELEDRRSTGREHHLLWFIPPESEEESNPDENNFLPRRMKDVCQSYTSSAAQGNLS
ncbi:unnamed protein product [Durusdinium trenchii]|uniref:Choline transporter-like protein n=2 Tax=Durusdinium trenchii TaxID=1381693 RepID=A0ABP0QGL5_9DINO